MRIIIELFSTYITSHIMRIQRGPPVLPRGRFVGPILKEVGKHVVKLEDVGFCHLLVLGELIAQDVADVALIGVDT